MATLTNQNGTSSVDTLTYNKAGTYHALAGNDTIKITGGSGIVVYADSGSNIINVTGGIGHTVKIATSDADSDKQNGADKLTINGANLVSGYLGAGKDEITLLNTEGKNSSGVLSQLHGGAWGDTFTIGTGASGYQLYGDAGDDIFNINSGSNVVCWGGAANDTFNVTGGTGIKLRGGDSADVYNVSVAGVDMQLGYGNDVVNVTAGNSQKIKANLGINTINLKAGSGHVITADIDQAASQKVGKEVGYGVDKVNISGSATKVTANLGDGKDEVTVSVGSGHKIYTEGWGDTLNVFGNVSSSTFDTGDGDDIINISGTGSNNTYYAQEGKDKITVSGGTGTSIDLGSGNDEITISAGSVSTLKTSAGNNDLWLKGTGQISTLYLGSGRESIKVDGGTISTVSSTHDATIDMTITGGTVAETGCGSKDDWVAVRGGTLGKLNTGAGDDYIEITGGKVENNSIYGGSGNDLLYVTMRGYNLYGEAGDDVFIINTSLEDGARSFISSGEGKDIIFLTGRNVGINAGEGEDLLSLGDGSRDISASMGAGKDTVYNDDEKAKLSNLYIDGGAGADEIEMKTQLEKSTFTGGANDDYIFVGNPLTTGEYNVLNGEEGDDRLTCNNNKYTLVVGGDGSDTIKCTDITYGVVYGDRHILSDTYPCSADTINLNNVSQSYISGSKVAQRNFEGDNNTITVSGTCNKDIIFVGYGNNTLWVNGALTNSILIGGQGNDTINISNANAINNVIFGGRGDDTYTVTGGSNNTISDKSGKNIYNISGGSANYYKSEAGSNNYYISSGVQAYNMFHSEAYGSYNVDCNAKVMIETNPGSGSLDKINICGTNANQVDILVDKTFNIIKINNILIKGTKAYFSFGSSDLHQSGSQEYFYDDLMGLKVGKTKKTASLSGEWNSLLAGMGDDGRAVGITELNSGLSTVLEDVQADINQVYSTCAK